MRLKKQHFIALGMAFVLIVTAFLLVNTRFFFIIVSFGVIVGFVPFVLSLMKETRVSSEKEEMFMEFARNLAEGVRTGTPISRCIVNLKNKNYSELTPHVKKLARQISLGIPLHFALVTFSNDVNNKIISRSLTLIGEAERAGGNIGGILEAVADAVTNADKLRKERKAAISTLIAQGYIIFSVFLVIIILMQFRILPLIAGVGQQTASEEVSSFIGSGTGGGAPISPKELANSFLFLLLTQGFFTGLTIGKLAEGNVKAGLKHSFALMFLSFVVSTISNLVFGG